jgi:hypothetical protein
MEVSHSTAKALVQATTVDIFNERDPTKRRQLMEKYWSPNITCYQTGNTGKGFDNMEQVWRNIHSGEMESYDFSFVGSIWVNHNLVYAAWEYGPGGKAGEKGMRGSDIMLVGKDEKVEVLYAMIEGVSTI